MHACMMFMSSIEDHFVILTPTVTNQSYSSHSLSQIIVTIRHLSRFHHPWDLPIWQGTLVSLQMSMTSWIAESSMEGGLELRKVLYSPGSPTSWQGTCLEIMWLENVGHTNNASSSRPSSHSAWNRSVAPVSRNSTRASRAWKKLNLK